MDRKPGLRLLSLPLALTLLACEDSTIPEVDPVGTYQLESIDGNRLPFESMGVEFIEGSLTIHADETFSSEGRMRIPAAGGQAIVQTEISSGSLIQEGNRLHLTSSVGETIEATFDRSSLMVDGGLVQMVFRR